MADALIQKIIYPAFQNEHLALLHDGAFLHLPSGNLAFTTDSFVVHPLFFPGGDIGKLAATGTMNDLAMCGAIPLYMSCSLIIEEGFSIEKLQEILSSLQRAAKQGGMQVVTGDTKVIERSGRGGLFINTSGIGCRAIDPAPSHERIEDGDVILLSGDIGRHALAIMGIREGLRFTPPLESDCENLTPYVMSLINEGIEIHAMRDITRGGLASILLELSVSAKKEFLIEEEKIPICDAVHGACEVLGIDPLYSACEGRFVIILPQKMAERALDSLRNRAPHLSPSIIGTVKGPSTKGCCIMQNSFGMQRYIHKQIAEQLPRIC